jgi:hypothetical protein
MSGQVVNIALASGFHLDVGGIVCLVIFGIPAALVALALLYLLYFTLTADWREAAQARRAAEERQEAARQRAAWEREQARLLYAQHVLASRQTAADIEAAAALFTTWYVEAAQRWRNEGAG